MSFQFFYCLLTVWIQHIDELKRPEINSMRRRCVELHEANGGHIGFWRPQTPTIKPNGTFQIGFLSWPVQSSGFQRQLCFSLNPQRHVDKNDSTDMWPIAVFEKS